MTNIYGHALIAAHRPNITEGKGPAWLVIEDGGTIHEADHVEWVGIAHTHFQEQRRRFGKFELRAWIVVEGTISWTPSGGV